jgi:hypothetical protein
MGLEDPEQSAWLATTASFVFDRRRTTEIQRTPEAVSRLA